MLVLYGAVCDARVAEKQWAGFKNPNYACRVKRAVWTV